MIGQYLTMLYTLGMMCAVLLVGRAVFGLEARHVGGYSFRTESVEHDNPAVIIRLVGMLVGLLVAVFGAYTPTTGTLADAGEAVMLLICALVALMASRYINDRFMLPQVCNNDQVVKQKNVAVAMVEAATYIATAAVFAGGMADPSHGLLYNIVWFVIGQCILIGLAKAYGRLLPTVFTEVASDNRACALSLAGLLLAAGVVIGVIIRGVFEGWLVDLMKVGTGFLIWLAVIAAAKAAMYFAIIPGNRVVKEMVEDRNWGIGLADAAITIAFTAVFVIVHT